MDRIEVGLTPEEWADLEKHKYHCWKQSWCCEPVDWEKGEAAIRKIYRMIGMKLPRFVRRPSPCGSIDFVDNINDDEAWRRIRARWRRLEGNPVFQTKRIELVLSYLFACSMLLLPRNLRGFWLKVFARLPPCYPPYVFFGNTAFLPWSLHFDWVTRTEVIPPPKDRDWIQVWAGLHDFSPWVWWPFSDVCILCDRPAEVHWTTDDPETAMLHRDGGPAVRFRDGWSLWMLYDVCVPQWLAETRDYDIDPKRIRECDNVEVRREFVRKVGLNRIYHALGGKLIHERTVTLTTPYRDKWPCRYRLVELNYGSDVRRRVLEMPNPSMPGVLHVEYVPMECETVEQAMNFRLGRTEDQVDDEAGKDWWLQGDVIITPEHAVRLKRWPQCIA